MDVCTTILSSPITPVSLSLSVVALVVLSFIRGWILPKSTVELLLAAQRQRAEDFKAAWESEKARNDLLTGYVKEILTYAETADKVLKAIPLPKELRDDS